MAQFYHVEESASLTQLMEEIDSLQAKINSLKPLQGAIWATIQEKLRIEWTYDSNALEGSTLIRGETYFFLREGLTVEGKPFKDFLDARNHAEAIDYVYQIIKDACPLAPGLMKEFNYLLLSGITHTYAPAVIKKEQRRAYLETLALADERNLEPFTALVARSLLNTQQIILKDFNENLK